MFEEVVVVDFEFIATTGDRPVPICLVAKELRSGRVTRLWRDEFARTAPYSTGPDTLFVAYYASAEIGCHLTLGWKVPERILDLFTEFRAHTNGLPNLTGNSLLGALAYYGLDSLGATEKADMRELIMGGGPWSDNQCTAILDYCESDVQALERLLPAMVPMLDLPRALLRGRYMGAAAAMEHNGVPIDAEALARLRTNWTAIQDDLIAAIDRNYGVFDGRTFKRDRFAAYLIGQNISWPRLETGELDLADDTFREMARSYPQIAPLRELRSALSDMRLSDLAVGKDGRNRCLLSAFRARTGRNQPSNSKFIFGPSVWLRGLIKPSPGHAVAYIDWSQQEIGIAAALSGDPAMIEAYESGDPYLAFAKQAGAVPPDATKRSHGPQRELFKACALAVNYGMGPDALAMRIGQPKIKAVSLLQLHRETYRRFWQWSDAAVDQAMAHGVIWATFGWRLQVGPESNPRSHRNFAMQANGAEMLRIACCLGIERGIEICAPVHDAVLIAAPIDTIDAQVTAMRAAMAEASGIVLNGFELRTDVEVVRWPERYSDQRGAVMWRRVMELLEKSERDVA
jgi:DNA polymerase I